jgi:UDP-N-acetylmuramate--alanine ligase
MIELKDIQNIYFIGIGGIGMSALARYFNSRGVKVSGYDKTPTVLTIQLEAEGMFIHYTDEIEKLDQQANAVIYTPAVPTDHKELNWYREQGYPVMKRSDILQIITKDSFNICIAGTHGKTSITTMTGHILRHTGYGCNAFLGGISVNYNSNFWASDNNVCVVEADEYDRSFLKLDPDVAVITAMDADHLDIYGTVEAMEDAFVQFAERIKPSGLLIRKHNLSKLDGVAVRRQLTYQLHQPATKEDISHNHEHDHDHEHDHEENKPDIYASNIRTEDGGYVFDVQVSHMALKDVKLHIGGMHNIENALAAISIARLLDIDAEKIKVAVAAFKGVKRRFEYIVRQVNNAGKGVVFVDDYAHHPEELHALIKSAKHLFPGLECTVIFQPHLFTRTRDLAAGFASALSEADHVMLLPIYPARELPIAGVTSALIAGKMLHADARLLSRAECLEAIASEKTELLIAAGAGDIDTMIPEIAEILKTKMEGTPS